MSQHRIQVLRLSLKTDEDGVVRTATIKYKITKSDKKDELNPSPYKYAERNVRNLALIVTAQECKKVETINLDDIRFNKDEGKQIDEKLQNDEQFENIPREVNNSEENEPKDVRQTNNAEIDDENQAEEQVEKESEAIETSQELPKTSSGRKVKTPKKLDL